MLFSLIVIWHLVGKQIIGEDFDRANKELNFQQFIEP